MTTTTAASRAESSKGSAETDRAIKEPAEQVKREGQRLAARAKEEAARVAEDQKGAAADYLKAVAAAVDRGAHALEEQGYENSASLASGAANEFGSLVDRLAKRETGELLQEVEAFARRRPALFFGAAFLVGFGGTRFLKSSGNRAAHDGATPSSSAGGSTRATGRSQR